MRLAHLDLGILLSSGTDKAGAERHLREAIRLDPEKTEAHYQLGRLLRATGREPEAAAEFAKVKELGNKQESPPPLLQIQK